MGCISSRYYYYCTLRDLSGTNWGNFANTCNKNNIKIMSSDNIDVIVLSSLENVSLLKPYCSHINEIKNLIL